MTNINDNNYTNTSSKNNNINTKKNIAFIS